MVLFNVPLVTGKEFVHISELMMNLRFCGDNDYTKKCNSWLEQHSGSRKVLLTTSCTHALEMTALLLNLQPDDEVIMPSYTFVSTANAFALRGAKIVFVDIRPDTMNVDENLIEAAITKKTKAIVPVHYAGVGAAMDRICEIALEYKVHVIEDAAQGVMASFNGKPLGSLGTFGCFSFHETKNLQCGEGGALLLNDNEFVARAEIIREKGTNRSKFYRGQIDKYTWVDIGSSYLPSDLVAAFLYAQFEQAIEVTEKRLLFWNRYQQNLKELALGNKLELPYIPVECKHNAHMFYLKTRDLLERQELIRYLKEKGIQSVFHYIPLHSSDAGRLMGCFQGEDIFTTRESERLLRLPLHCSLDLQTVDSVSEAVMAFYNKR